MSNQQRKALKDTTLLVLAAGLLALPALASRLSPGDYTSRADDSYEAEVRRNKSAVARLFGEFRSAMSDVMFVKTERYLHSGIGYANHIDLDELAQTGEVSCSHDHDHDAGCEHGDDHDCGHDHGEAELTGADVVKTLIRTPGEDWRHFIGSLEREVKPWQDPRVAHSHGAGDELLPWYWLAVASNPHNIRAYRIATFWLISQKTPERLEEALRFVSEGIANNPETFALYWTKSMVLEVMGRSEEALETSRKGARLAVFQRPEGGFVPTGPSDVREVDFCALMRMQAFLLEKLGRYEEAIQVIDEFQALVPEDTTMVPVRARIVAKRGA